MSVAVARPPSLNYTPRTRRMPAAASPSNFSQSVAIPGLIRLPSSATTYKEQRPSRSRQRKSQQQTTPQKPADRSPKRPSPTPKKGSKSANSRKAPDDVFALSEDSDHAAPVSRPATAPTAVAPVEFEPSGRHPRTRRAGRKDKDSAATAPNTVAPIPIRPSNPASVSEPVLSRSVPLSTSALPDWDLPPVFSTPKQQQQPQASPQVRASSVPRRPAAPFSHSEERLLVPWSETLEDADERAAAESARNGAPIEAETVLPRRVRFPPGAAPAAPVSPTRRAGQARPAYRHARTASVPTLGSSSSAPHYQQEFRINGFSTPPSAAATKYAGGRFQSAPAPTFIPMPSFQA